MPTEWKHAKLFGRLVQSPLAFAVFLTVGTVLFLTLTFITEVDLVNTHDVIYSHENGIQIIHLQQPALPAETLFIYSNRYEMIYRLEVELAVDKMSYVVVGGDSLPDDFPNYVTADILVGRVSLFHLIFVRGGINS